MKDFFKRLKSFGQGHTALLATLAVATLALLIFRALLAPGSLLLTSDDNFAMIASIRRRLPWLLWANWDDGVLLGLAGGNAPLTWNLLLTWLLPLKLYFNWIHALDLLLASMFLALFLRDQKLGLAGIILGILTAFWLGTNLTLTYAGHLGKYAMLWLLAAALFSLPRSFGQRRPWAWSILSGALIGQMLVEQQDLAFFCGLFLGAYALFLIARLAEPPQRLKALGRLIPLVLVALLVSGANLFATYTFNVIKVQTDEPSDPLHAWEFATQWSWPPEESIDFIAPGYMGWRSGEPAGPYWGRMGRSAGWEQTRQGFINFKLENQYIGAIPILLALFALLAAMLRRPRTNQPNAWRQEGSEAGRAAELIFWGCAAAVALLLAFGKFFPLYAWFYKLPLVNSIRNPNKFLHMFQLALGILAAHGLDMILRRQPSAAQQVPLPGADG